MKKVIIVTLMALLLAFSLTACAATPVVSPTPGVWNDRVFSSEYMGLSFALPALWDVPTDAQWVALMEAGESVLEDTGLELPEQPFLHMVAINYITGANVQITYQHYGRRAPSMDELIEAVMEDLAQAGVRVVGIRGTTRLGAHDWTYISTEMGIAGQTAHGRQFYNIYSGYIRIITVTTMTGTEELSTIMPMFMGIGDSPPVSVAITFDENLIDSWFWIEDADFVYAFFEGGSGIRGFSDTEENFQWRTSGDTLLIETDIGVEGWEFSVTDGDILTINSLQEPSLSQSLFRAGSDLSDGLFDDMLDDWLDDMDFDFDFDFDFGLADTIITMDLVDMWLWENDDTYALVFEAEGFGLRGFYPDLFVFDWGTLGDDHLLIFEWGGELENWTFTIEGDILTISSLDVPGMIFSYFRVS